PVAGTVRNTNRLLGYDGFVGVKTGSTATAGGCFAFRAIGRLHGKRTTITGVVLGQPGLAAAFGAAEDMGGPLTRRRAAPGRPQPSGPPVPPSGPGERP